MAAPLQSTAATRSSFSHSKSNQLDTMVVFCCRPQLLAVNTSMPLMSSTGGPHVQPEYVKHNRALLASTADCKENRSPVTSICLFPHFLFREFESNLQPECCVGPLTVTVKGNGSSTRCQVPLLRVQRAPAHKSHRCLQINVLRVFLHDVGNWPSLFLLL